MHLKTFLFLLSLSLCASVCAAQQRPPGQAAPRARPTPQAPAEPAPAPAPPPPAGEQLPPYEAELGRLSEILGSLHYLRGLCGERDQNSWRDDMTALIEGEAPGPERRARLMGSFNRGYRGVSETHRNCTPAARLLVDRYVFEGARLAREIVGRYGS